MRTLWYSCVKVHEPMELSFKVVWGQSQHGCIRGGPRAPKVRGDSGGVLFP